MATIQTVLTSKEMERYLKEMGLYQVWNDLMYPPHHMQEGELNHTLKNVYSQLENLHAKAFPYKMQGIAVKGESKFVFKNEAEFEKSFGEYFERRLVAECFHQVAKHPTYTNEQISKKVDGQAKAIFDQSIAYVLNELTYIIKERKITRGQQPFDFI